MSRRNPQTEDTVRTVESVNEQIRTRKKQKQTQNWTIFANNLNHKDNSKKVFEVLRSITKSYLHILISHAAITQDNTIPSYTQANILINHYASISHLPNTPEERKNHNTKEAFPTRQHLQTFHTQTNKSHHV